MHFVIAQELLTLFKKNMWLYSTPESGRRTDCDSPSCCLQGCGRTGRWPACCRPWPWPLKAETFLRQVWKWFRSHRTHRPGNIGDKELTINNFHFKMCLYFKYIISCVLKSLASKNLRWQTQLHRLTYSYKTFNNNWSAMKPGIIIFCLTNHK